MDGQTSFPFVIGHVVTTRFARELDEAMATEALTLNSMPTVDGHTVWCARLAEPVQLRIGYADLDRYDPAYVAEDEAGAFVWTFFVTIHPHLPGSFTAGARGVVADFAFVVDASLSADTYFDPGKVQWAATVVIDAGGASHPTPVVDHDDLSDPLSPSSALADSLTPYEARVTDLTENPRHTPGGSAARPLLLASDGAVSADEFRLALDEAIRRLAELTGTPVEEVPLPQEVKARKHSRHRGTGPSYSIDGEVRYHTADPMRGLIWKSSVDRDEALYWMVDDVARSLALAWARRAPAAATMSGQQVHWSLTVPMWQTLMTALDARWEARTRSRIVQLWGGAQPRTPVARTWS